MNTTNKILWGIGGIGAIIAAVILFKKPAAASITTGADGTVTIKDHTSGNTIISVPSSGGTTTTTIDSTGEPVSTVVSTVNGDGTVTSTITTPTGTQTVTNPPSATPVTGIGYMFAIPGVTLGIPTDLYNDYLLNSAAYVAGGYPPPIQYDHSVAGQVAVQSYNNPTKVIVYANPNGTDTFTNVKGTAIPNGNYAILS
jgi:hypothetical protein